MTAPLAIVALAAAAAPLAPGLWQVGMLVQGSDRASTAVHCHDGTTPWLAMALASPLLLNCMGAVPVGASGRVSVVVPCRRGGVLVVTGTVGGDGFDLVARRQGRVGSNAAAHVTISTQGRRIAARCPVAGA